VSHFTNRVPTLKKTFVLEGKKEKRGQKNQGTQLLKQKDGDHKFGINSKPRHKTKKKKKKKTRRQNSNRAKPGLDDYHHDRSRGGANIEEFRAIYNEPLRALQEESPTVVKKGGGQN